MCKIYNIIILKNIYYLTHFTLADFFGLPRLFTSAPQSRQVSAATQEIFLFLSSPRLLRLCCSVRTSLATIMGRYAAEPDNATKSAKARGSNLRVSFKVSASKSERKGGGRKILHYNLGWTGKRADMPIC